MKYIKPRAKKMDVMVADKKFLALWRLGKHRLAIRVYHKAGRIFWYTEQIARYFEKQGQIKEAIIEYQYLVDIYCKMGNFLPVPTGPPEVFRLGMLYAICKNRTKARRYLKLYLEAEKCKGDPAFYLRHKNTAVKILDSLND